MSEDSTARVRTRRRRRVPSMSDRRPRHLCRLPSPVEMGSVRIGVIASIAHRLPPASYGPWEQVASTLTEGFVARGHDVTLFATADSVTAARLVRPVAAGYEEDRRRRRQGLARACTSRPPSSGPTEFDVIAQPLRLHAADLQPSGRHPDGDDHPRLLLAEDPAGLPSLRRHRALRRDQRRRPPPRAALRGHHPPRHRHRTPSRSSPSPATTCCSSAGSTPTRAPTAPSRSPAGPASPLVIAGIIQDQRLLRDAGRAARRRRARSATSARSARPSATRCSAAAHALLHLIDFDEPFGLSVVEALATGTPVIASPRGSMPEIDPAGVTGFLVTGPHRGGARRRPAPRDRPRGCRSDAETRFGADRMVDDYLALFQRLTFRSDPGTGSRSRGRGRTSAQRGQRARRGGRDGRVRMRAGSGCRGRAGRPAPRRTPARGP